MRREEEEQTRDDYDEEQKKEEKNAKESPGPCAICERPAHGIHFGVLACRACAAFYRRSIVMKSRHNCRRANGLCAITKEERVLCRQCRFKKCLERGMREDNVQFPRNDSTKESSTERSTTERPLNRLPSPPPIPSVSKSQAKSFPDDVFVIDTTELLSHIEDVFTQPPPTIASPILLTALQRMQHALHEYRLPQTTTPTILESFDVKSLHNHTMSALNGVARWMLHCEEFTQMVIFKYAWTSMLQLERAHQTILLFEPFLLLQRRIALCNFHEAIDFDRTQMDTSFFASRVSEDEIKRFTHYRRTSFRRMFDPQVEMLFKDVIRPMMQLKVSELELVYMLCLVMWNIDGLKVCKTTLAASDQYKERISNELHDFYVYHARTPNYAARLIKLMNIIQAGERVTNEKIRLWDMGRLFDVFKVEVTQPDLFRLDS